MQRHDAATVLNVLEQLHISCRYMEHPAVHTMEDCRAIDARLGAPFCKNLFLQNRQGTQFYLLLIGADKPFRTAQVSKALGVSRLSFGNEEALDRLLGVSPGAITPMGLIFDTAHEVTLLADSAFRDVPQLCFHPCVNTASLAMRAEDFFRTFLPYTGHTPIWVDIPSSADNV